MRNRSTTKSRRAKAATVACLLSAVALGVWTLGWNTTASSAAVSNSPLGASGPITSKLEELHQRAAARHEAEEDDDYQQQTTWGHAITPERAATLAQQAARTLGLPSTQPNFIELQTRNGRPVYAVRFLTIWVFIDADLGTVVP